MSVKCLLCGRHLKSMQELIDPQKMFCPISHTGRHEWGEKGNNEYRQTDSNQTNLDDFGSFRV